MHIWVLEVFGIASHTVYSILTCSRWEGTSWWWGGCLAWTTMRNNLLLQLWNCLTAHWPTMATWMVKTTLGREDAEWLSRFFIYNNKIKTPEKEGKLCITKPVNLMTFQVAALRPSPGVITFFKLVILEIVLSRWNTATHGHVLGDDWATIGVYYYRSADRSRLRLSAACGLLRLARLKKYCNMINLEQLQRLALTIQVCLQNCWSVI